MKASKRIDKMKRNIEHIIEIKDYLENNYIQCYKYNYALDKNISDMTCFKSFIEVKENSSFLNIILCKPNESYKYVLEADKERLQ